MPHFRQCAQSTLQATSNAHCSVTQTCREVVVDTERAVTVVLGDSLYSASLTKHLFNKWPSQSATRYHTPLHFFYFTSEGTTLLRIYA